MNTNSRKGFSLPELITVVVVVAILGAIAIGVVSNLSSEAQRSAGAATAQSANRMLGNIRGAITGPAAVVNILNGSEAEVLWALNTGVNVNTVTGVGRVTADATGTNEIRFIMNPIIPGGSVGTGSAPTAPGPGVVTGNNLAVTAGVVSYASGS